MYLIFYELITIFITWYKIFLNITYIFLYFGNELRLENQSRTYSKILIYTHYAENFKEK